MDDFGHSRRHGWIRKGRVSPSGVPRGLWAIWDQLSDGFLDFRRDFLNDLRAVWDYSGPLGTFSWSPLHSARLG